MTLQELIRGTRLVSDRNNPIGHAQTVFDHGIGDIFKAEGLKLNIHDVYSASRQPEHIIQDGVHHLVFDHALCEYCNILNAILEVEKAPDMSVAMLLRALAEVSRSAGNVKNYGFFVKRASEVKMYWHTLSGSGAHSPQMFWQSFTIMAHEAGHMYLRESQVGRLLQNQANTVVADEMKNIAAGISGLLEANPSSRSHEPGSPRPSSIDLDFTKWVETSGTRDVEALTRPFLQKIHDHRFLEEVGSDFFAAHALRLHLEKFHHSTDPELRDEATAGILTAAVATFQNVRLLEYLGDLSRLFDDTSQAKIDPLKVEKLVEFTLRGNLFAKRILEVWQALCGASGSDYDFEQDLAKLRAAHTEKLFVPLNDFLDSLVFQPTFSGIVDTCLEQDGFDLALFNDDPWKAAALVDGYWQMLVMSWG